jgi:hypothetical protein
VLVLLVVEMASLMWWCAVVIALCLVWQQVVAVQQQQQQQVEHIDKHGTPHSSNNVPPSSIFGALHSARLLNTKVQIYTGPRSGVRMRMFAVSAIDKDEVLMQIPRKHLWLVNAEQRAIHTTLFPMFHAFLRAPSNMHSASTSDLAHDASCEHHDDTDARGVLLWLLLHSLEPTEPSPLTMWIDLMVQQMATIESPLFYNAQQLAELQSSTYSDMLLVERQHVRTLYREFLQGAQQVSTVSLVAPCANCIVGHGRTYNCN